MHIPKRKNIARKRTLAVLCAALAVIYLADLFSVQIVHGAEYRERMNRVSVYTIPVKAARGEILDCNGESLVSNRLGYSVIFEYTQFPSDSSQQERNDIVSRLLDLFAEKGQEWNDAIPLIFDEAGNPAFPEDRESEVAYLKSQDLLNLNDYATAQNCLDALIEKYELENYTPRRAREIGSVYYSMFRMQFSAAAPYTFAEDVSSDIVAMVKENSDSFPGVDISAVSYREYDDGTIAPHILGTVGVISAEEYEDATAETEELLSQPGLTEEEEDEIRASSYAMDDNIGKSGVEQVMESYLRGTNGEMTIEIDSDGNVTEYYSVEPESGNTVILTIDKELQKVTQDALEKRILELTSEAGLEAAGAAVVIDCRNGEVLASASYPSYDLSTYYDDYTSLAQNSAAPLWNRVLQSTYAPGSTMKPVIALAALQEGVIDENTTFYCDSSFEYMDQVFGCLEVHGNLDVRSAIDESCNIFFYNTADKLGITKMNTYSSLFGLGSKTGIELPEAAGVLAGPAYRESLGQSWYSGDTIQAAIGQSDNLFTPIQLANYCATIANGGTRYVPHVTKSVKSSDYSETVMETETRIAADTGISEENMQIVKEGMWRVAETGFCRTAFANVPVDCGAKTGTSQVDRLVNGTYVRGNNGFLISFGPYEDAEIAIAVVIENVNSGTAVANVAADIYEYYFGQTDSISPAQNAGTLLN